MFSRHTISSCEFQMLFSLENRKVRNCSGRNRNVLMMQRSRLLWFSFTHISCASRHPAQTDQGCPTAHQLPEPGCLSDHSLGTANYPLSSDRYLCARSFDPAGGKLMALHFILSSHGRQ